jgi:hypothetical protein
MQKSPEFLRLANASRAVPSSSPSKSASAPPPPAHFDAAVAPVFAAGQNGRRPGMSLLEELDWFRYSCSIDDSAASFSMVQLPSQRWKRVESSVRSGNSAGESSSRRWDSRLRAVGRAVVHQVFNGGPATAALRPGGGRASTGSTRRKAASKIAPFLIRFEGLTLRAPLGGRRRRRRRPTTTTTTNDDDD